MLSPGCSRIGVIRGSNSEPRTFSSDQMKTSSPLTSRVATPWSLNGFSIRTSVMSNSRRRQGRRLIGGLGERRRHGEPEEARLAIGSGSSAGQSSWAGDGRAARVRRWCSSSRSSELGDAVDLSAAASSIVGFTSANQRRERRRAAPRPPPFGRSWRRESSATARGRSVSRRVVALPGRLDLEVECSGRPAETRRARALSRTRLAAPGPRRPPGIEVAVDPVGRVDQVESAARDGVAVVLDHELVGRTVAGRWIGCSATSRQSSNGVDRRPWSRRRRHRRHRPAG